MTLSCSSCSRTGRTRIGLKTTSDTSTYKRRSRNKARRAALNITWFCSTEPLVRGNDLLRPLDEPRSPAHNGDVSSPHGSAGAARVLIVDDDVSVTDTFSRMLRLEGYEVWAALSADEGLTLAQTHKPHAIILDLRMPLTSGLQVLRAIRAIPGLTNTPVAIVTGDYYLDDAQAGDIAALGAQLRYKPLWLEELVTLARELLNIGLPH